MATKPIQKERTNRSAEKKDLAFHPFPITPESAQTAVLLLESKEPEILCHTLRAITKFSAQDMLNREVLFDLDAIRYILVHIDHPETNVRRFALKALAQLCQLPRGPEVVLKNSENLRRIAFMLAKVEDIFVLEFASLCLAELTREPVGCDQLVSANILASLFSRMKNSLDPDVQKNCLQTLCNLLADPVCASEVTKNQQFSWPSLLALMQSKYLAIQHAALTTVNQLICAYKNEQVQKTFRASTGVLDLCDILESYGFRDVHAQVLGVLKDYAETEENAAHVYKSGCLLRLLAYLEMALPAMKPHCMAVLTKMSFTSNGRDALFQTGTDLVFCTYLPNATQFISLIADAAMGVANMTKLLPSAVRMSDTNIIESLCDIISDDLSPWFYVRMNVLLALSELCRIIPKAAFRLVEPKTFASLRNINRKFKDNPIEAQRLAAKVYLNLQSYHVSMRAMVNKEFMLELLNMLARPDIRLKIATCAVIAGLMKEDAQDLFTLCDGENLVSTNLRIEHVALRTALCSLITASVTNESADKYLEAGTVHYMVHNRMARYVVSAWEPALEAIFRAHPSAKFAYTGRLDLNDFTYDGFYVMKRLRDPFPPLADCFEWDDHRDPVFVVTFHQPPYGPASRTNIRTPYSATAPLPRSQSMMLERLPDDVSLREYLYKMRMWFGDHSKSLHYFEIEDAHYEVRYRDKCAEVSTNLKQRALVLAQFVCEQMSGLGQERDCSMPSVDTHLADIVAEIKCPVIGLGWVRAGGDLERAVLYKCLADRLGVPCALHRRGSAHAWCEVAVPELAQDADPSEDKNYPAGLLRINYAVVLRGTGRLVKAGGYEAKQLQE